MILTESVVHVVSRFFYFWEMKDGERLSRCISRPLTLFAVCVTPGEKKFFLQIRISNRNIAMC